MHRLQRIFSLAMLVFVLLFWTGCATPPRIPHAQESALFHTLEAGFHIVAREASIRYVLTLEPKAPVQDSLFFTARYENPADAEEPFVEKGEWRPEEEYLFLRSPSLSGLESGKIYRVAIQFFDDGERKKFRDSHEVLILSNIDSHSRRR